MTAIQKIPSMLTAILLVALAASSCTKKSSDTSSSASLTVTGGGQSTDPGKAFAQDIMFLVRSASGAPLPNVSIVIELLTDGPSSVHVAGYEILQTNNEGKAIAKAVGGNLGGFESKFKAYLSKDTAVSAEFSLFTNGAPGGGGASDGNVSGETDSTGGGGKTSGVEDGNNVGSTDGGGVNNTADQGGNNTNSDTSPAEVDIAYYLVETLTTANAPITAGVPFGLRVSAKDSTGKTVTKRDGVRQLTIDLATKATSSATGSDIILKTNYGTTFGVHTPDVPTLTSFTFVAGVVELPIGQAITIRKYVANMIIHVIDDTSKKGESSQ